MKERTNRILFLFIIPMSIALISSYLVGNLNAIFFADVGHREKITIKVYDSQTKTTLKNVEISFLRFCSDGEYEKVSRPIGHTNELGILYHAEVLAILKIKWYLPFIAELPTFSKWKLILKAQGYKEKEVIIPSYTKDDLFLEVALNK
jgi:hypothetical protein